jgi:hypothetical protein
METKNAIIESTMLGIEDHGIMTFYLNLKYDGSCQSAGGYSLDSPFKKDGKFIKRVGTEQGLSLIMEVLNIVGVGKWEDLKGKAIRVKSDNSGVYEIGNLMKEDWLNFKNFFSNYINHGN